MKKTFVCDVEEQEAKQFLGIFEMKSALESLVMLIAGNNDILQQESLLYKWLVEDYKEIMVKHNQFWSFYFEKYEYLLDENTQFSLDFKTNKIYIIPIESWTH